MSKIIVKSKSERGFRRAGIQFTREGVELDTSKLKKGVLEDLQAEPNLVVAELVEEKKSGGKGKGQGSGKSGGKSADGDLCYRVLKPFELGGVQIEPAVEGQEPVFVQLGAEEAAKLAGDGLISTAEGDVSLPPEAKPAGKGK